MGYNDNKTTIGIKDMEEGTTYKSTQFSFKNNYGENYYKVAIDRVVDKNIELYTDGIRIVVVKESANTQQGGSGEKLYDWFKVVFKACADELEWVNTPTEEPLSRLTVGDILDGMHSGGDEVEEFQWDRNKLDLELYESRENRHFSVQLVR